MPKGLVIAGTHSGCGKTTVTLGILAALKKKGLHVQSFKTGPDFIDAGLHRLVTGRHARNLDIWMCGEDYVKSCFYKHAADADISVVEGVMGMYDGEFSTAMLSTMLNLPIILVVDAYGMAESAGAVVKGFVEFWKENTPPDIPPLLRGGIGGVMGVIFNRVASESHFKRLKNNVQDVPVLGYLPRNLNFEIPHRHLGLTVAEENPIASENIERLADAVLEHIDVTLLVRKCGSGNVRADLRVCPKDKKGEHIGSPLQSFRTSDLKVAIAYDKAFCFYYEDNLDLLKEAGAEIVTFSPLSDSRIPDNIDALYIGGGYPELWAKELSQNTSMLKAVHDWADSGRHVYAECGGLMYLSQGIHDFDGNFFKMAGIFPFETQIPPYPPLAKGGKGGLRPHLGYREIILKEDCILGKSGYRCRGHEFHYSEIKQPAVGNCCIIFNNKGQNMGSEGYRYKNTIASYMHVHYGSNPDIARNFINFIRETSWKT